MITSVLSALLVALGLAIIARTIVTLVAGARRDEALIAEALRLQNTPASAPPMATGSRP